MLMAEALAPVLDAPLDDTDDIASARRPRCRMPKPVSLLAAVPPENGHADAGSTRC